MQPYLEFLTSLKYTIAYPALFFKIFCYEEIKAARCIQTREEGDMAKKGSTRKIHRSAKTGRFVSKKYVKSHPDTTVTEITKK